MIATLCDRGARGTPTTDELPVYPVDVAIGHYYPSTHPASVFHRQLTLCGYRDDGSHVTLAVT